MTRICLSVLIAAYIMFACTKKPKEASAVDAATVVVVAEKPEQSTKPAHKTTPPSRVVLYYPVNTDTVSAKGSDLIRILAARLTRHPTARLTVSGYADTTGRAKYNQRLSERRAKNVAAALGLHGFESGRVYWVGLGELSGDLAKSRKVEISISP